MLNSAFTSALQDFAKCEIQILFDAPLNSIALALNDAYIKWEINGLGEAYGFWFRLKSNEKVFIVKTLVQIDAYNSNDFIEWSIDSENLDTAKKVFEGLELGESIVIKWKKM